MAIRRSSTALAQLRAVLQFGEELQETLLI